MLEMYANYSGEMSPTQHLIMSTTKSNLQGSPTTSVSSLRLKKRSGSIETENDIHFQGN